jgi:outer membrane protein assembly factor BamE (lipoprotein component of BamABCDE complex)
MLHRKATLILAAIGLLTVATIVLTPCPGVVGDVELAKSKVKNGMSRDQVRSALGAPHREDCYEWDYSDSIFFRGFRLRVHFGDDGRVTSSECWLD